MEIDNSPANQQDCSRPSAPKRRFPRVLRALRHRNYRLYFIGQIISLLGTWMQNVAQGWLVLRLTDSALYLGLVSAAAALPTCLLSLPAGVLADLIPKRKLLLIAQCALMLLAFVLAWLTLSGVVTAWHIIIYAALTGVVNAFEAPTRQAFTNEMTGGEDLLNAIALNSLMFHSARFIGPAIAGFLVAYFGEGFIFLLNGVSFFAVIYCLVQMRVRGRSKVRSQSRWLEFTEVFGYLGRERRMRYLLVVAAVMSFFGFAYLPLMPMIARDIFNSDARGLGLMLGISGFGSIMAALMLAHGGLNAHRDRLLVISGIAFPLLIIVLAQLDQLHRALIVNFCMGWSGVTAMVLTNTAIQSNVPDHLRARVLSLFTLSVLGLGPLGGLLLGGCVSAGFPLRWVMCASGLVTTLLMAVSLRAVLQQEFSPPAPSAS